MMNRNVDVDPYHVPRECSICHGGMRFVGVGEYHCEKCGSVEFDDYGKVRLYIEQHRGATAKEVEDAIGVSQRSIRYMLKEGRIEVADGSKVFLKCEACGCSIRMGRYCPVCESRMRQEEEILRRVAIQKDNRGYSMTQEPEEGQKRFKRSREL